MYLNRTERPALFFLPYWLQPIMEERIELDYDDIVSFDVMSHHFSQKDLIRILSESVKITINGQRFGDSLVNKWIENSEEARKLRAMMPYNKGVALEPKKNYLGECFVTKGNNISNILYIFMRPKAYQGNLEIMKKIMVGIEEILDYDSVPINFIGITSSFINAIQT